MEIEFNAKELSLSLNKALLIYEGHDADGKTLVAVTEHDISGDTISPDGRPLDVPTLARLLSSTKPDAAALEWTDPRTLATAPQWTVWWTEPCYKEVFIGQHYDKAGNPVEGKDEVKATLRRVWFPGFVWCGHRSRRLLYLFAFRGDKRPKGSTILYTPAFGPAGSLNHIFQHSSGVCLGSAGDPGDSDPKGWEKVWWDSTFKTAGNLEPKPYEIKKRFKRLGALASVIAKKTSREASD